MLDDLNIDILTLDKPYVADYLTLLAEFGIECPIASPTREEILSGKMVCSCIDHVTVRTTSSDVYTAVISSKLADHYFVARQCVLFNSSQGIHSELRRISILDLKKFDNFLTSYNWTEFLEYAHQDNAYKKLANVLDKFYNSSKINFSKKTQRRSSLAKCKYSFRNAI